jgi:hypothetical protein
MAAGSGVLVRQGFGAHSLKHLHIVLVQPASKPKTAEVVNAPTMPNAMMER